jgi:hypothetical protein
VGIFAFNLVVGARAMYSAQNASPIPSVPKQVIGDDWAVETYVPADRGPKLRPVNCDL